MGIVVLLKFGAKCFDVLAWPLFALGYPLCASIRAIESNSNSDIQKLVTYWVLFSLISLFDHAFVKLLEWLPFWPYLKLLIIFWLVIPHFDGAFYVYKHLVRPCFSMDPQVVIKQFNKPKEFVYKRENFLVAAERYVKENGSEALEKLIASKFANPNLDVKEFKAVAATEKQEVAAADLMDSRDTTARGFEKMLKTDLYESKCKEPNVAQKDIQAVELTEEKEAAATKWLLQVERVEPNLTQIEKSTDAAVEIKETAAAAGRDNKVPEIRASKKDQKEITCGLCRVKIQSESTLISHLQGKRHKAKCEEVMKANMSAANNKGSSSSPAKKPDQVKEEPKKCVSGNGPNKRNSEKQEKVQVNGISEQCKQKNPKNPKNPGADVKCPALRCYICNVSCPGETGLASHLNGRKHLARIQELTGFVGGGHI